MTCTISSTQDSKSRCWEGWEGHVVSLSQITQRITWIVGINHHKTWALQILSVSTNCMFCYKDHIQYLRISDPSIWEERGFHKYLLSQTCRYYESGGLARFRFSSGVWCVKSEGFGEGRSTKSTKHHPKNSAQKRANYFLRDSQQVCPRQWRTSNFEKINATSLKTKNTSCYWQETSLAIGSPFLTSKNGGVNIGWFSSSLTKKKPRSAVGGFNPVEHVYIQLGDPPNQLPSLVC